MRFLRGIFSLCAVLGLAGSADAETPANADYKRYEAMREFRTQLFILGREKFGVRMRTAMILAACNKPGLSGAIEPSTHEEVEYLGAEFSRIQATDGDAAQLVRNLSANEKFDIVAVVVDQLIGYEVGYREGVLLLSDKFPAVCDAAVMGADEILKRK